MRFDLNSGLSMFVFPRAIIFIPMFIKNENLLAKENNISFSMIFSTHLLSHSHLVL